MEAENNPETNSSNQPTTKDTTAVVQEDPPKTNGEATPETLAMQSPAKARSANKFTVGITCMHYSTVDMTGTKQRLMSS